MTKVAIIPYMSKEKGKKIEKKFSSHRVHPRKGTVRPKGGQGIHFSLVEKTISGVIFPASFLVS